MNLDVINTEEYSQWVRDLKEKIQTSQIKAAIKVNTEMLHLYWEIGKSISNKLRASDWGSSIVDKLSTDLKREFPNQKGFSRSNLFSMRKWFEFYAMESRNFAKVQQLVGQISWGHHQVIISKTIELEEAKFYCQKTVENNWSRAVLIHQIDSELINRVGKAKAEFAGKMNLYLSAVDDQLKTPEDNPTIGLLLCKSKSEIIAEYALRGTTQPIGIAEYDLRKAIPDELKSELPTIEKIEKELATTIAKKL